MKKIILVSLLFGLVTSSAFATYYKTSTSNCSDAAMLAKLDRATAQHRAVITEVTCNYTVPSKPAPVAPKRTIASKKFVHHEYRTPAPVVVYKPTVTVVAIEEETCTCFDCGC